MVVANGAMHGREVSFQDGDYFSRLLKRNRSKSCSKHALLAIVNLTPQPYPMQTYLTPCKPHHNPNTNIKLKRTLMSLKSKISEYIERVEPWP